jgi:hypothetical protein
VYNVPKAFSNIPVKTGRFLRVWNNNIIEAPRYSQTLANRYQGIWGALNHFQSIKRMPEHLSLGNFVICAGTDPHTPESQLFVAYLDSEKNAGHFEKNTTKKLPPSHDTLIKKITLSDYYWCTGSIDMAGAYLAVPVYNNKDSQILFYHVHAQHQNTAQAKDLELTKLDITIERPTMDAPAAAFTRMADGHYMIAVWSNGPRGKGLDFYFSKDTDLGHGFEQDSLIHIPATLFCNYTGRNDFQNINFVHDFDGTLYLIALANNSDNGPLRSGVDIADLFEIRVRQASTSMIEDAKKFDPQGVTAQLKVGARRPYVKFVHEKHMFCKQGVCNFSSGATIYVPDQQHIFVYSLPNWLTDHGKQLTFAEYSTLQKTYPGA